MSVVQEMSHSQEKVSKELREVQIKNTSLQDNLREQLVLNTRITSDLEVKQKEVEHLSESLQLGSAELADTKSELDKFTIEMEKRSKLIHTKEKEVLRITGELQVIYR